MTDGEERQINQREGQRLRDCTVKLSTPAVYASNDPTRERLKFPFSPLRSQWEESPKCGSHSGLSCLTSPLVAWNRPVQMGWDAGSTLYNACHSFKGWCPMMSPRYAMDAGIEGKEQKHVSGVTWGTEVVEKRMCLGLGSGISREPWHLPFHPQTGKPEVAYINLHS